MSKVWRQLREFLPMAAIVLLCMLIMPVAQAHSESNGTASSSSATATTVSPQQQNTTQVTTEQKASTAKPKSKVATKPRDKSVLDAEVLESPLSYFRNAFSSDEDEADASRSGVVMITVKALVATLLSTVM